MSLKNWSTTPASNASVDSINWAEGMNPSAVNDSSRQEMSDVKEFFNSITGGTVSGTVAGTVDAITLTTVPNPPQAAYAVNQRYLFKATGANTITNPTLNVGALGAKTIKLPGGAALIASQWATNAMILVTYDGTDMILIGGSAAAAAEQKTLTRNTQTGTTYTVLTGDRAKYLTMSNAGTVAVTLPQANGTTFGGGWYFWIENIGVGTVTITPTTSTLNLGTALVLRTGEWALVESDDTNYRTLHSGQVTGAASVREIGTRGVPLTTQNAAYTFALIDAGGMVLHDEVTARIYTIPANAAVAFPIGTVITIVNNTAGGALTVAITTDTLRRGDGTAGTGSRTVGADRVASIVKTKSTEWMITGSFT